TARGRSSSSVPGYPCAWKLRRSAFVRSALAAAMVTPGFRLTMIPSPNAVPYDVAQSGTPRLAAYVATGTNTAGGWYGQSPTNPSGATPMIVYLTASTWRIEPNTSVREPNSVSHILRLSTATGAGVGGASSLAVKYRPMTGGASKNPKNPALTTATSRSRVSFPAPTANVRSTTPAVCENDVDHLARSTYRA